MTRGFQLWRKMVEVVDHKMVNRLPRNPEKKLMLNCKEHFRHNIIFLVLLFEQNF